MLGQVHAIGEATTLSDRKRRAGQRLVIGFHGHGLDADLRALLRLFRPAGFILFGRNVVEPAQVLELARELSAAADPAYPPLLFIDQEGGPVQRIGSPATVWPAAPTVAHSGLTREVMRALGTELRAMGLHLNLAPVADIERSTTHSSIRSRTYGDRAEEVARQVVEAVEGLHEAHVGACLKHYPGLGAAPLDTHDALPAVELDRAELDAVDLVPFAAGIDAGADAILLSHALYPAIDEALPASLSPAVVDMLRSRFDGLTLTDDLEMGAIAERWPVERAAVLAARAGMDVALIAHDPQHQAAAYEALVRDQELHRRAHRQAEASARRLQVLRERLLLHRPPRPPLHVIGCPDHRALRDRVLHRAGAPS